MFHITYIYTLCVCVCIIYTFMYTIARLKPPTNRLQSNANPRNWTTPNRVQKEKSARGCTRRNDDDDGNDEEDAMTARCVPIPRVPRRYIKRFFPQGN